MALGWIATIRQLPTRRPKAPKAGLKSAGRNHGRVTATERYSNDTLSILGLARSEPKIGLQLRRGLADKTRHFGVG